MRSEAAIIGRLVELGYAVLLPFGVNQRYDLVLDLGGEYVRAQCKTGRFRRGSVEFSTQSVRANMNGVFTRGYEGEVDVFLVYCPESRQIYAVPVEEAPRRQMSLRVEPSKNGQELGVHPASSYQLPA